MSLAVACAKHGTLPAATVCRHLRGGDPTGVVVGGDHTSASAICAECDAKVDGDWTAVEAEDLVPSCALCFGEAVAGAQDLSGLPEPQPLFAQACTQMAERNKHFLAAVQHEHQAGWAFSEDHGLELIGNDAKVHFRCACDPVGSFDPADGSWLWAWANDDLSGGLRARASVARAMGERLGLGVLAIPTVPDTTLDGAWHLAQLGAWLLGGQACYQLEVEGKQLFVAILRIEAAEAA